MSDAVAERVALKVLASDRDVRSLYRKALVEITKLEAWSKGFGETMRAARRDTLGLPDNMVWQEEWIEYWKPFQIIQDRLLAVSDEIRSLSPNGSPLYDIWDLASDYMDDPPKGARITDAISDPRFLDRPTDAEREAIAYPVADLVSWNRNYNRWLSEASSGIKQAIGSLDKL